MLLSSLSVVDTAAAEAKGDRVVQIEGFVIEFGDGIVNGIAAVAQDALHLRDGETRD